MLHRHGQALTLLRVLILGALVSSPLFVGGCAVEFEPEPISPAFPSGTGPLPTSGFEVEFSEVQAEAPCDVGTYEIALVVDPGVDYHWYRQNPDGTWSGKSGHPEATNLDASGNTIDDPRTAD